MLHGTPEAVVSDVFPSLLLIIRILIAWFLAILMAGLVYYFLGLETKGKSIEQIDKELATT